MIQQSFSLAKHISKVVYLYSGKLPSVWSQPSPDSARSERRPAGRSLRMTTSASFRRKMVGSLFLRFLLAAVCAVSAGEAVLRARPTQPGAPWGLAGRSEATALPKFRRAVLQLRGGDTCRAGSVQVNASASTWMEWVADAEEQLAALHTACGQAGPGSGGEAAVEGVAQAVLTALHRVFATPTREDVARATAAELAAGADAEEWGFPGCSCAVTLCGPDQARAQAVHTLLESLAAQLVPQPRAGLPPPRALAALVAHSGVEIFALLVPLQACRAAGAHARALADAALFSAGEDPSTAILTVLAAIEQQARVGGRPPPPPRRPRSPRPAPSAAARPLSTRAHTGARAPRAQTHTPRCRSSGSWRGCCAARAPRRRRARSPTCCSWLGPRSSRGGRASRRTWLPASSLTCQPWPPTLLTWQLPPLPRRAPPHPACGASPARSAQGADDTRGVGGGEYSRVSGREKSRRGGGGSATPGA
jgi:hypothetical protein